MEANVRTAMRPRNGLVLIRVPKKTETRTSQGIYVPKQTAGQQFDRATVVSVGRGNETNTGTDTDDLAPGDEVLVTIGMKGATLGDQMQYTGIPFECEGDDLFLVNQHDIYAIFHADLTLKSD